MTWYVNNSLNNSVGDYGNLASSSMALYAGYCYSDDCCKYKKDGHRKNKDESYTPALISRRRSRTIKTTPRNRISTMKCPDCGNELVWQRYSALASNSDV